MTIFRVKNPFSGVFESCFVDVQKLFRHFFGSKRHNFKRKKVLPNNPSPLGSRVSPKTERGARGCVGGGVVGVGRITFLHFGPC